MFRHGREEAAVAGTVVAFDADRLAVQAARRDPLAFEPLYRKYVAQIYSFALYETRDRHAAEDLTELVFLRAMQALPRFDDRGEGEASTFRTWLFQIARNAIANERRRERRHPEAPLELAVALRAPDDPAAAAVARDEAARAWDAIDRLPEERRRALVLRFVEEMSAREIGEVLGRSEGAVRVLIHRALRSVADELAAPTPAAQDAPTPATETARPGRPRWWRR
ncbi:MAG: sigma-70 family RNA polymerase sigma factor [Chloroflexota bacterium]